MSRRLLFLTIPIILITLSFSCKSPSGPEPIKNPREYTWTIDTLAYPGSFQTNMNDIWGNSPNDVYVVGHNDRSIGVMWHYNGSTWVDIKLNTTQGGNISGAQDFSAIYGFAPNNVWAVGERLYNNFNPPPYIFDSTLIIHFNGSKWVESDVPIKGRNLQSIHGNAPDNLWASGFFGTLYHFNGIEWRQDSVPINPPSNNFFTISNVAVVSKEQAFLVGYTHQNDLAKTTNYFFLRDRGAWVVRDSFFVQPGRIENKWGHGDLWVSPSDVLYSCGGGVHRWNGSTWERLFNHPNYLSRMAGTSDNNIFVVGHFGTVLHYNGVDWHEFKQFSNPNSIFTSVWTDGKEAFIVGHTTDFPQKTIIFHGR